MQTATEAEEHLRVIRSLMEKATIYRAVSAPTALAGGIAGVIVGTAPVQGFFNQHFPGTSFQIRWLLALFVTLAINGLLILREAQRRGDPVVSPGMRTAFRALLPPVLCGGVFFALLPGTYVPAFLAIFYGLGLLATAHFAPKSIAWLGWSFLVAGLVTFIFSLLTNRLPGGLTPDLTMLATFGGFHFIYAACTWPRRASSARGTP
ncbi:MAG TPA: hypothetical protein VK961_04450 [Chthoniobacter sp.]|nr:hypothetical protein [Chthoniobacter sp.]